MRLPLLTTVAAAALVHANGAMAQEVLDRVDPARVEERARGTVPEHEDTPPAIAIDPATTAVESAGVMVGAIDIVGLRALPRSAFADIVEAYIGRSLTGAELAELADRLANRARATYPLASATIEQQTMRAGVLRVRIDEGAIDDVVLDGPQNAAVMAAVAPLANGAPVATAELERRLLLAGDIDGVTLGKVRVERRAERNVLVVPLAHSRASAQLSLDNDSTRPLGPLEIFGTARVNGVIADGDSLQALVLAAVPQVEELLFGRLRYTSLLGADGTRIIATASYSNTRPGSYLTPLDITGQSWFAGLDVQHPVMRTRRVSLWVEAGLGHRELMQDRAGIDVRRDRLTTLQGSVFGNARMMGGNLRARMAVSQGLDVLDATQREDPLSSRDDADGTYTKIAFASDWRGPLWGNLGATFAIRSQLALQPLLVAEEIGLGGAQFGRGYDYSERTGDQGTMGYAELHLTRDRKLGPIDGLEVYAFADGGTVTNLADGFGGGSLFSSGGGIRFDVDRRTDAGFELAIPLSGDRYDSDDDSPRLRFSFTRYF